MTKKVFLATTLSFLFAFVVFAYTRTDMAGSYRCRSYNVSGGGSGNCRLMPPIVLKKNGTYSVSSEKGTYTIKKDIITLSKSKLRGPGKIVDKNSIRFEYDYRGFHHTITYLKEGAVFNDVNVKEISVEIILLFDKKDGSLGSLSTVELVPEGELIDKAKYKPTAIAVYDGDKKITASFFKSTNKVRNGAQYDVYTNSGFEARKVGQLDLRQNKFDVFKKTISVTLPSIEKKTGNQPPATTSVPAQQESVAPSSPPPSSGVPCNPNIPMYTQPGCQQ